MLAVFSGLSQNCGGLIIVVVSSEAAFLVESTSYNVVASARGNLPLAVSCPQDATSSITSMAPSTARGVPATKDAENTSVNAPTWDTSPNTFPQYYQELLAWLPKQESRFTLLRSYNSTLPSIAACTPAAFLRTIPKK